MSFTEQDLQSFGSKSLGPLTMTQADLDAIRARAEEAAPEPWEWKQCYQLHDGWENTIHWAITDPASEAEGRVTNHLLVLWHHWPDSLGTPVPDDPDLQFIARARADIPALLAEIEALRRACYHYATQMGRWAAREKK